MNDKLILPDESYAIMGACFEVYRNLGCGLLEPVYQEALEIELALREIPFVAQPKLPVVYKGRTLKHHYQPDFVCYGNITVEIKAVSNLVDEHRAQILNYLNISRHPLGLLVNFGHNPLLEHERFAFTAQK